MLGDPLTPDEEAAARRALKLALKLTEDFNANHPAKAAASKFVDTLFKAGPPVGAPTTRRDREIKRAADELHVPFYAIYDLFDGEPSALEEFIFGNLLRIVKAAYALGQHAAPDGRNARPARRDRADTNFSTLVRTLVLYLNAYRLEPKL